MSENFYPFINGIVGAEEEIVEEALPLYKEIAWDFVKDVPLTEKNDFKIVEGNEAICVWIYHAIKTYRYAYSVYSWDFGSEIDTLMGRNYTPALTKAEVTRYVKEALLINPYILEVDKVDVNFNENSLGVSLRVTTVYGKEGVSFNV